MQEYINVLKKYAVFEGRASRKEYWTFTLVHLLIIMFLGLLGGFSAIREGSVSGAAVPALILLVVYCLAVVIPGLAVLIRRLHDTGRSGWWLLIEFVPYIGGLVILVFTVMKGDQGNNSYGPNPLGSVAAPEVIPSEPTATV